jgi:hypothetical protein
VDLPPGIDLDEDQEIDENLGTTLVKAQAAALPR